LLTLRCPYAVLNPRLDVAAMNNKVKVSNPGAPCTCGIWIKPGEPDEHWPDCARVSPTPEPSERQEHLTRTLAWVSTHEGVSKHVREIVSLALYGDVPTPPPPVEQREIGWLVEAARTNGPQRYRTMEQGMSAWTTDPNKAIRFARRADAEMFADEDDEAWHICEHMWVDPAPEETHTAACARFPSLADPELKWRDRPCTCRQRQRHALTKGGEQA
jgi:hypothetical protein